MSFVLFVRRLPVAASGGNSGLFKFGEYVLIFTGIFFFHIRPSRGGVRFMPSNSAIDVYDFARRTVVLTDKGYTVIFFNGPLRTAMNLCPTRREKGAGTVRFLGKLSFVRSPAKPVIEYSGNAVGKRRLCRLLNNPSVVGPGKR